MATKQVINLPAEPAGLNYDPAEKGMTFRSIPEHLFLAWRGDIIDIEYLHR